MQCRNCGTEIADKAIICYRCGTATTDPVRKPVRLKPRRRLLPAIVAAAVLLLLAVYMRYVAETAPDPARWRMLSTVLIGAAAVVVILRLIRRP